MHELIHEEGHYTTLEVVLSLIRLGYFPQLVLHRSEVLIK